MTAPQLPLGFHRFHRNEFINYQLNRAHSLGYLPRQIIEHAAPQIRSFSDVVKVFGHQATEAERREAFAAAASCARLAEFFAPRPSQAQVAAYSRFRALWDRAHRDEGFVRHDVPYEGGALSALTLSARNERNPVINGEPRRGAEGPSQGPAHRPAETPPQGPVRREGKNGRGTVLVFGGFDSLIEEFFAVARSLAEAGFDVVAFDGPGQGGTRTVHGVTHTHDWERPTGAILDAFEISKAALVGLSMGGYWAIRAAAHEPRITRVVAWPPVYDWLARFPRPLPGLIRALVRWTGFMNLSIRLRMKAFPILQHVVAQACWLSGNPAPVAAARWLLGMNAEHLDSAKVTVPTLLMTGARDKFQPPSLARHQARALVNSNVTTHTFTDGEQAANHCQVGNFALALEVLTQWLHRETAN